MITWRRWGFNIYISRLDSRSTLRKKCWHFYNTRFSFTLQFTVLWEPLMIYLWWKSISEADCIIWRCCWGWHQGALKVFSCLLFENFSLGNFGSFLILFSAEQFFGRKPGGLSVLLEVGNLARKRIGTWSQPDQRIERNEKQARYTIIYLACF